MLAAMSEDIRIHLPAEFPDQRGLSFAFGGLVGAVLGRPQDLHLATIRPGCLRGNHFHARRREVVVVLFQDRWQLVWDQGPDRDVQARVFEGCGAVAIEIPPNCSHAFHNTGGVDLLVASLTDGPYDPTSHETTRRVVHDGTSTVDRRSRS